ncbi:MAG: hypothetical protein IT357_00105 [Gemmatimonadaceae bacterium]|nr:hypothetical protein [Gemmatimonadaceae bacterium]
MMKLMIAALSVSCAAALSAQPNPGQDVRVDVRVLGIVRNGDTTTVTYRLHVERTSGERLRSFTVDGTGAPFVVHRPEPRDHWVTSTEWRGRRVARWAALALVAQGDSTPPLVLKAVGLPGITSGWLRGHVSPNEAQSYRIDSIWYAQHPDGSGDVIYQYMLEVPLVGIDPPLPTATTAAHAAKLRDLTTQACAYGWITDAGACASLNGLAGGPPKPRDYLAVLDAGRRAGSVNTLAYWMLKVRAEALSPRP